MSEQADVQLRLAGWFPDRRVDAVAAIEALRADGHQVWPELTRVIEEFNGLKIASGTGGNSVLFDAKYATEGIDSEWARAYEKLVGCALSPVGTYSHMTIYLGENGTFYGGFDNAFGRVGTTVGEVVDDLLNTDPPVPLDMEVPY